MRTLLGRAWDPAAAVVVVLVAVFTVVGYSYRESESAELIASSASAAAGAVIVGAGLAILVYLPLLGVFRLLDRRWADDGLEPTGIIPMREAMRRWLLPSAGTILVGWLAWLLVHFPGNVDSDTITQKLQWLGLQNQTDHHPWFDTMVFGLFWNLGDALGDDRWGLFIYLLLQEAATAGGVALVLVYLSRLGMPSVARWALTVAVAVLPAFVMAPSVMSKDAFAAVFWLPFLVLFAESLRTRGAVLARPRVALAAIAVTTLLILSKRTSLYLVLICAVVLVVVVSRALRVRIGLTVAGVLALTGLAWPMLLVSAWGITPGTSTDMMTVPVQQTARIAAEHGDEIPEEERAAIDAVLRWDGLAEAYVPTRSDSVKGRWNLESTTGQKLEYFRVWAAQVIRYPATAASATIANTYEYFAPVTRLSMQNTLSLDQYIDFWTSRSLETTSRAEVEAIADALYEPAALDGARSTMNDLTIAFNEGNLLSSKALYASLIPLAALAYAIRRRSWLHVLMLVPLFVTLAFLVASPIALSRYIIPMIHGAVFVVGITLTPMRWERRSGSGSRASVSEAA
ncbi:hypothetical protein E4U02_02100 [Microbacterium paludicola]|uniref:Glycosyltransferase RgtA/B/C/D-like domain-containing protein n=1 Tax=Microbacterium paludicola TaxID=300019 RepID=A0A4Y9FZM8_9MICO|nr:DUF6020 family protein [Microbacterium paludicola]MBF0815201.1 hypothetical protein [Microbacterium paludicola]TFU34454.1 hypothetical protein E4U02_02100 [Microbacterium paludicola]